MDGGNGVGVGACGAGPSDQHINPHLHRLYEGEKRTPSMWESKAASRVRKHFITALRFLLHSYKMIAREDLPEIEIVPGYFVMLLPGRVRLLDRLNLTKSSVCRFP
jgi:hypothetical protein